MLACALLGDRSHQKKARPALPPIHFFASGDRVVGYHVDKRAKIALGVGGLTAALLLFSRPYSFGGPDKGGVSRDPKLLLPSFAAKLNILFARMRAAGWDPILNEGYRTPARAAELAKQGVGVADSMHSYGAAVDIISASRGWSNLAFFALLGQEAEALGLTWGGRFSKVDRPHVQAIPVAQQAAFRKLAQYPGALDRFVSQQLAA